VKKPPSRTGSTGSTGTLGDLLRRQGVPVAEVPVAPSPPPSETSVALDFGGAAKIVIRRERKGRGGKTATIVEGWKLPPSGLERIARELKRALGCGASIEGSTIVVHGDLAERVAPWLQARGARRVVIGN
jgi:translation initiation factor 1